MAENENKNISSENPPLDTKDSNVPKIKSPIPQLENYIDPIKLETLQSIEQHIELTLTNFTKKLEQSKEANLIIKRKVIEMQNKEILSLFKEKESITEINDTEQFETIFDCIDFYHFVDQLLAFFAKTGNAIILTMLGFIGLTMPGRAKK